MKTIARKLFVAGSLLVGVGFMALNVMGFTLHATHLHNKDGKYMPFPWDHDSNGDCICDSCGANVCES